MTVINRNDIVEMVRRFGGTATDAVLDPDCKTFTSSEVEGLICYRDQNGTLVILGDPICPSQDAMRLAQAFFKFAENKNVIFVGASASFANDAKKSGLGIIHFGNDLFLDPTIDDPRNKQGTHASLVRRKTKQAVREGVTIHEYTNADIALEHEMEELANRWVVGREGPQIHISRVYLFNDRHGKRWFYAKRGNDLVGCFVLNKLENKGGWLLNHLMLSKDAPNGTPELLVITALETLAKENCKYLTFGMVPTHQLGKIDGFDLLKAWLARFAYRISWRFFDLGGFMMFWDKFLPQYAPLYLIFFKPKIGLSEIRALTKAFNVRL